MFLQSYGHWCARGVLVASLVMLMQAPALAFEINPNNTIPGVVANSLIARGNGVDWNTGEILMVLTAGSVYNDPDFDSMLSQQSFWNTFPDLEFDSWVGIPGDFTTGILSGAGDLGDLGPPVIADQKVSVTWYNTRSTDTGVNRIANISLTDDARGTFAVLAGFNGGTVLHMSGWVFKGVAYFKLPGDLNNNGFVGLDDLDIVLGAWNQHVPPRSAPDPSGDGFVGIEDLDRVLAFWNAGTPPAAAASVPEPASMMLILLAGPTLLRRRA